MNGMSDSNGIGTEAEGIHALADVVLPEQGGQADAEEGDDEPGGDLVGTAGQHHERVHERQEGTSGRAGEGAEPHAARLDADDVGGERAGTASTPRCRG